MVTEKQYIDIGGRRVGRGYPTYIVAEMSGNHNQDYESAAAMLRAAKDAGADAVKLQTYTADTLTIDSDKPPFILPETNAWGGRTLYDLYGEAFTPWKWQPLLKELADDLEIDLFSSPFDATAADFLDEMGVDVFKIASFEIMDLPLLRAVAAKGKPMIISTGMATMAQIDDAVRTVRAEGVEDFILLQCASAYPAPPEALNLLTIPHLAEAFGVPSGFSDHSHGTAAAIAAVALGACVIEKHFKLSDGVDGPDSFFSVEPSELKAMVDGIRTVEASLGSVLYGPTDAESQNVVFQRSMFFVEDIKAGDRLTADNVRVIRPGDGLAPKFYEDVIGKKAARDVERGTPVSWSLISG